MLFTLFWIAYEAWQRTDEQDQHLGQLMVTLLDAAEAAPQPNGAN